MRRLFVSFALTLTFASGFAGVACGSRSELLGVLGRGLEGEGHDASDAPDGSLFDAGPDGSNDDDASRFPDGALRPSGDSNPPPNPCSGYQAYAPWPAFQRCSGHVGRTDAIGPKHPVIDWESGVGVPLPHEDGIVGPPTIAADGTIYVANLYGQVVAFAPNGSTNWAAQLTFTQAGPSAVAVGQDGALYVELDQLYALTSSGAPLWTADVVPGFGSATLGPSTSSVTLSQNGTLYVGTSTGLVALSSSGAATWTNTNEEQGWTPAIDPAGVVYSADAVGNLLAMNVDGTSRWTYTVTGSSSASGLTGWIQTAPVVAEDGTTYFGAVTGFFAFTAKGTVAWQIPWASPPPPQAIDTLAIGSDGTVYLVSPDQTLSAISAKGKTLWTIPMPQPASPPVIDGDGIIYLISGSTDGGFDANLIAVTPKGELAWSLTLPGASGGGLAVAANGTIYASTSPNGLLYAIGESP